MAKTLLPDPIALTLEKIVPTDVTITVIASTRQATVTYSCCGKTANRVHSRYLRTVADLPWQGISVRFLLNARKFFCDNKECKRRIFTEPLPQVVQRYGRKTVRLMSALTELVHLVGGEAASRIARQFGLLVSPDALLQRLKSLALPSVSTPRVLGIDDFAFRKGHVYGTLLIDIERGIPVDLLPDREAKTVEEWLKLRPGVEILCRDRGTAYKEAADKALPNATQVADRWHLLKNLSETLTRFFDQHRQQLTQAAPLLATPDGMLPVVWPPSKGKATQEHSELSRERRKEQYEAVLRLRQKGIPLRAIARQLNLARGTVIRYVGADAFPEHARHKPRPTSLDPYKAFLQKRWLEGERNHSQLHREIVGQGFAGSDSWVSRYLLGLRQATETAQAQPNKVRIKTPSGSAVAALVLRKEETLSTSETAFLEQLGQTDEKMGSLFRLTQQFLVMVRHRQKDEFAAWITQALESGISALVNFAQGLQNDKAAVEAALSLPWSNGPTEGQVNRLKFIKRQGYGRASFDLLKRRVLPLSA